MMEGITARPGSLPQRFAGNVSAIAERVRRVSALGSGGRAGLSLREGLSAAILVTLLVLAVGFGFDRIAAIRAEALPRFVTNVFGFISEMGKSQWELYPTGIAVLILLCGRWSVVPAGVRAAFAEIGALLAYCFAAIAGIGIVVNIVKQFIGRGRPPTFEAFGPLTLQPFRFQFDFQSFPSGHSATAGALIAIGFLVLPRFRLLFLIFALAVCASRVVVSAHYPSDVLAGLIAGYVFSLWLAERFTRAGWAFRRGPTGLPLARTGAIRRAFRSRAATALALAGLVDALAGRSEWMPALRSIGAKTDRVDES